MAKSITKTNVGAAGVAYDIYVTTGTGTKYAVRMLFKKEADEKIISALFDAVRDENDLDKIDSTLRQKYGGRIAYVANVK